jgi:hypothetical protein
MRVRDATLDAARSGDELELEAARLGEIAQDGANGDAIRHWRLKIRDRRLSIADSSLSNPIGE